MLVWPGVNDSYRKGPVPTGLETSKSVGTIPRVYSASSWSRIAYGWVSGSVTVLPEALSLSKSRIRDSWPPAGFGALGSATRRIEKSTSSAVTVLPLWKVTPSRSVTVQVLPSLDGSTDSASAGASL